MSGYGWFGVLLSSCTSALAMLSYGVMALPYFDNATTLDDLKAQPRRTWIALVGLFGLFLALFAAAAHDPASGDSSPLALLVVLVIGLPISLLFGSNTWGIFNERSMNTRRGVPAIAIATLIGLAELAAATLVIAAILQQIN